MSAAGIDHETPGFYLNRGTEAPREYDFVIVEALMSLAEMLGRAVRKV